MSLMSKAHGKTLTEARRNLKEALATVIEANRELAAKGRSRDRVREPIVANL
jgi:predicted RNase H-like HicB family nuclease